MKIQEFRLTKPQSLLRCLLFAGWLLCGWGPLAGQEATPDASQEKPSIEASDNPVAPESKEQPKAENAEKDAPSEPETKDAPAPKEAKEMKPEEPASGDTKPATTGDTKADDSTKKEPPPTKASPKRVIGATERIQELQSGFIFLARIDTGAKSCSLHVDELKIEDESKEMGDNVGKTIHFLLRNGKEKTFLAKAKIRSVVRIKNANGIERRYKVKMEFQCKDVKKRVFVTLNDRAKMRFPLLIGRSFLRNDFLVDVDINSTD